MKAFLALVGSSGFSAAAGVLLKLAAMGGGGWGDARALGLRLAAVGCYGAGFMLFAAALKRLPLETAYPAMVGMTVLLILLHAGWSGRVIGSSGLLGATLIAGGIYFVFRR